MLLYALYLLFIYMYILLSFIMFFTKLVQGADQADFRAQLTRLGEGVFTDEDWRSWMGRELNILPATDKNIVTLRLICCVLDTSCLHDLLALISEFLPVLGVRSLANASRARQFNPLNDQNPPGVG